MAAQPEIKLLSTLAANIYADKENIVRTQVLAVLENWKNSFIISSPANNVEENAIEDAINLAIKITQEAYTNCMS